MILSLRALPSFGTGAILYLPAAMRMILSACLPVFALEAFLGSENGTGLLVAFIVAP